MYTFESSSLTTKLLVAGTSASFADFLTFPLDTAKVRLQIQGEAHGVLQPDKAKLLQASAKQHFGLFGTISHMVRHEGPRSLYNGLSAGLQRQMCFASVRIGLYDTFKTFYQQLLNGDDPSDSLNVGARIAAGLTTGALAVLLAQPTDVVKVRFQASVLDAAGGHRYASTLQAYKAIATKEGVRGLWKGTFPNIGRNAIVNVAEIVCYDTIKDTLLHYRIMKDGVPLHFSSAVIAGFCTTLVASPVDVVKTRYMNSSKGEYKGALDVAVRTFMKEGFRAFYKGFVPSFCRLVSWNIIMWITYEQVKLSVVKVYLQKKLPEPQ